MKKIIFAVTLLIGLCLASNAQTPIPAPSHEPKPQLPPEEKAAKLTKYMTTHLELTSDQQTKVAELNTANAYKISEIKKKHKDKIEAAKPELKPIKAKYNADLKVILTPAQNKKWAELKKKNSDEIKKNKEASKNLQEDSVMPEDLY